MKVKSIESACVQLNKMFDVFNELCFENKLSKAQVVVEKIKGAYGCFWKKKQYHVYTDDAWLWKIAINPAEFQRPIADIASTLLHEMCHQYCQDHGIDDCSRSGYYHNKAFKTVADDTGYITANKTDKYGYSRTVPTEDMKKLCKVRHWDDFEIVEKVKHELITPKGGNGSETGDGDGESETPKTKQSTRKHVCPCCGAIARTTKDIPLICGLCHVDMVQEVK